MEPRSQEELLSSVAHFKETHYPRSFLPALATLSTLLNTVRYGYEIRKRKLNFLSYMDDLKVYAANDKQLKKLLDITIKFSDDISKESELDKCAKATSINGKLTKNSYVVLNQDTTIKDLDQEETYKYLGINDGDGIQHSKLKEHIRKLQKNKDGP